MELLKPEQCIGNQEILYLISGIIKDIGTPVRMLSTPWIRMLIQWHAVKPSQTMCIFWKMCRYPIQDHIDSILMHVIHKIHKIFRQTISSGRCIIIRHLIAPGPIKRILCNTHQFNMRISHFFNIICNHRCQIPIIIKSIIAILDRFFPGSQMHLIDCHRLPEGICPFCMLPFLDPRCILPFMLTQIYNYRRIIRTELATVSVRICFIDQFIKTSQDLELIYSAFLHARNKQLMNTGWSHHIHRMQCSIPHIKIANHTDPSCIRSPYRKIGTFHTIQFHRMRTQLLINLIMFTLGKQINIHITDLRLKCIRICQCHRRSILIGCLKYIVLINLFR